MRFALFYIYIIMKIYLLEMIYVELLCLGMTRNLHKRDLRVKFRERFRKLAAGRSFYENKQIGAVVNF